MKYYDSANGQVNQMEMALEKVWYRAINKEIIYYTSSTKCDTENKPIWWSGTSFFNHVYHVTASKLLNS
jgi:hypothetical protein